MNSLSGLFLRSSEYRRGILEGGMVHFANGVGVVLSRKVSITFNYSDFFPAAPFLQRAGINPCHRQRIPQDMR